MRCPRCGNENPGGNRFCGMCGATLLSSSPAPPQPSHQPPRAVAPPTPISSPEPIQRPAPEAPRTAAPVEDETPTIAGPSFLGLNDPAPERKRASLSIDPHSSSRSSNLDYVLDDVEEPKSRGAGKIFLFIIALALAVGFGYLRFRTHGFPWATAGTSKPTPTASAPADTDSNSSAPAAAPSITPEPQPAVNQPASSTAPSQPASAPSQTASGPAPTHANSNANPAPATKPEDANPASSDSSQNKPADTESNKPAETAASSDNSATDNDKDSAAPAAAPAQPKADTEAPATKPRAASRPVDAVAEAQKYIYGRGVAQDCDRGLRILKPAANQANSKAMIEMGALYSAGLCTPHDLPTAYRWFALALRKDPSNDAVQTDLQKLWGEMTQPERQLAIKLTQ